MDLDYSPEQVQFRDEVRDWLADHAPREPRPREPKAMRDRGGRPWAERVAGSSGAAARSWATVRRVNMMSPELPRLVI